MTQGKNHNILQKVNIFHIKNTPKSQKKKMNAIKNEKNVAYRFRNLLFFAFEFSRFLLSVLVKILHQQGCLLTCRQLKYKIGLAFLVVV